MQKENAHLVSEFIEEIWNRQNFKTLSSFIHPDFKDHSLPPLFPTGEEGLTKWIMATSQSFEHATLIEAQVSENEKCMIKVSMALKHTGPWRDIPATGISVTATGYRFFKISEGRIIEHWGLIDGQAIENQLKNSSHGCKIAE